LEHDPKVQLGKRGVGGKLNSRENSEYSCLIPTSQSRLEEDGKLRKTALGYPNEDIRQVATGLRHGRV